MQNPNNQNKDNSDLQWEALLLQTFGSDEPKVKKAPPAPRKRRLWLILAAAAALLFLAALLLFRPKDTISPELRMCKDALEQWQSNKAYHIMQVYEQYGNVQLADGYAQYLRHGDDRIYLSRSYGTAVPYLTGTMNKNGKCYLFSMHAPNIDNTLFPWTRENVCVEVQDPWPIAFIWEDDKVHFRKAEYHESGAVKEITVTVLEQSVLFNVFNDSYNVVFHFSEDGTLTAIKLQLAEPKANNEAFLTVISFRMVSTDSEKIQDYFVIPESAA